MIWALLLIPATAGLASLIIRPNGPRRVLLLLAAAAHAALVAGCWVRTPEPVVHGWMAVDSLSLLFLGITSVLFLATSVYAVGYLGNGSGRAGRHGDDDLPFVNFPEAVFVGCLLLFLATMTLVSVSRHLGLMWVGVEATTLASAPLIYFHRHHRSLEATWKYLLICSVGIALALLGNFFVAVAARSADGAVIHLTVDHLIAHADRLNPLWLKAAFLLFLVGYGTKMGLAPLHTWLPDAHSEAPSVVSALLSGALLNCAFLTILRAHSLLSAAGLAAFSADLLVLFGLISMGVAAVFILGQSDFKRMLAYSSVEHMG
ncbi:MAG TPA: NADH dehydrogenase FAD-containing subunit, partial [Planctomycetaceae bacterium]|nr:NADH dehydrogenase FAD-containing subunit [Planctomycetaceae bacterium]